jgi:hypothetical protein
VPRFHSEIFTTDLRTAPGLYRGAGFVFEKREGEYPGAREAGQRQSAAPRCSTLKITLTRFMQPDLQNLLGSLEKFHQYECHKPRHAVARGDEVT